MASRAKNAEIMWRFFWPGKVPKGMIPVGVVKTGLFAYGVLFYDEMHDKYYRGDNGVVRPLPKIKMKNQRVSYNPRWRKIAGRGSLGDYNWGASGRPRATLEKELRELKKHIGERVVLSGGGGPGYSIGRLRGAEIVEQGYIRDKPGLKVYLTGLKGVMKGNFDPWIDSWQISVAE